VQRILRFSIQQNFGEITQRTAREIGLYLDHSQSLLETLVVDLANTNLSKDQTQRILENYAIRFPEFEKVLVLSNEGRVLFSTNLQKQDSDLPAPDLLRQTKAGKPVFSESYLSEDLTPVIWFLLPMKSGDTTSGVLAAQIDLMQMWEW